MRRGSATLRSCRRRCCATVQPAVARTYAHQAPASGMGKGWGYPGTPGRRDPSEGQGRGPQTARGCWLSLYVPRAEAMTGPTPHAECCAGCSLRHSLPGDRLERANFAPGRPRRQTHGASRANRASRALLGPGTTTSSPPDPPVPRPTAGSASARRREHVAGKQRHVAILPCYRVRACARAPVVRAMSGLDIRR